MSIIEAIILGIVQGLTEFIPVSSSGHLVLFHTILGVEESGLAFDVALHFGTLLALLLYFRNDIYRLTMGFFLGGNERRLAFLLFIASLPAFIVGYFLNDLAESAFRSSRLVAVNLLLIALFMIFAERYARRYSHKTQLEKISTQQGLAVGMFQALALIPGVSRSGSTISAGLLGGIDRVSATRFSFLLGIPAMIGAIIKIFVLDGGSEKVLKQPLIFAIGITAAFASGLVAIIFMLRYLAKHSLNIFAYYRIVVALLVLLFSVNWL